MEDKRLLGSVTVTKKDRVATITFYHPSHNSLPGKLLARLRDSIVSAGKDEEVKVIVLQSEGDRTFCAGASFDELSSIADFETGKQFFMGFANVINAMRKCPKFIIGRVQGKAVGGGVGLCAATDYCIASKWASVKLSELAIGIGPFVVGPAVERKMGTSAMTHLAINATEWRTAQWAKEKGLFTEVFDTVEQVDEYITHLSDRLAQSNPEAMRLLKEVFGKMPHTGTNY
jgi:methylglutaconyl-CoA hydratase